MPCRADESSPLIHISLQYLDHGEDFDAISELPKLVIPPLATCIYCIATD